MQSCCKYCGQDAKGRTDQCGEDECISCYNFFMANPTPPIPAPTSTLVNLNNGDITVKPHTKKENK